MNLFIFLLWSLSFAQNEIDPQDIKKIYSPKIQNSTLYIRGRIGSHIYDYISYEEKSVRKVNRISLNSFGGDHTWALSIAEKLRDFKLDTALESGNFCASACVYLFAAGKNRIMDNDTWLGVHGARLGSSYLVQFYQHCPQPTEELNLAQLPKNCLDFLNFWYLTSLEATQTAFSFLETQGVSRTFSEIYFSFADSPDWYGQHNVLKKPDWVISADDALKLGLATQIKKKK